MHTELANYREHMERYRTVTLQTLDALADDADLAWRPTPDGFTLGQQLLHIAQAEDFYARGLFGGAWDQSLLRFDGPHAERARSRGPLRAYFEEVRARTRAHHHALGDGPPADEALGGVREAPHAPVPCTLRWWLWFVLEHEIHHKAQAAVYLRQMGRVAPFYAYPFPPGARPDVAVRAGLGGV
jgi:uncharacterized damage-inducible protein DinB